MGRAEERFDEIQPIVEEVAKEFWFDASPDRDGRVFFVSMSETHGHGPASLNSHFKLEPSEKNNGVDVVIFGGQDKQIRRSEEDAAAPFTAEGLRKFVSEYVEGRRTPVA